MGNRNTTAVEVDFYFFSYSYLLQSNLPFARERCMMVGGRAAGGKKSH